MTKNYISFSVVYGLLESYGPTDFSSNPSQTHLTQLITVFRATWSFQTGVLELKSAGRCLSRSRFGDPWSRVCSSQNSLTQDIKACYAPISPQWKGLMPPVVQLYTSAVFGLKRKHRTRKSHVLHEHNRTISPSCKSINGGILHANDHLTQANQIGEADLCTAVYHPAASVRFITTSTGIRSATASLLALMVRRMPFPAFTGRDTQNTLQRGRQAHKRLGLAVLHTGV